MNYLKFISFLCVLSFSDPAFAGETFVNVVDMDICAGISENSVAHVPADDVEHKPTSDVNIGLDIYTYVQFEIPVTVDVADRLDLELTEELEMQAEIGMLSYDGKNLYFNGEPLDDTNARLKALCDQTEKKETKKEEKKEEDTNDSGG